MLSAVIVIYQQQALLTSLGTQISAVVLKDTARSHNKNTITVLQQNK